MLWQMRRQLLLELVAILPRSRSTHVPNDGDMEESCTSEYSGLREEHVVKASALLRLYCALMGIAGLRSVYSTLLTVVLIFSSTYSILQYVILVWQQKHSEYPNSTRVSLYNCYRPTDEESEQLLQLMTSRPPATPAGVRFVSLSFCKLLAFPTLVRYKLL